MAETLTSARATLLAAHLAASVNVASLRTLIRLHPQHLTAAVVLRILLLFIPETTEPSDYAGLASDVASGEIHSGAAPSTSASSLAVDVSSVENINETSARKILENLNVIPLPKEEQEGEIAEEDRLATWLIARARRIEAETGVFGIADMLLLPFTETEPRVYAWHTGVIQVLSKLVYTHPELGADYGLARFESLDERAAVHVLLGQVTAESVARDVEELVAPYVRYRRKTAMEEERGDPWRWVWAWMAETAGSPPSPESPSVEFSSLGGFGVVVSLVEDWDGPDDEVLVRDGYAKSALGACYLCSETGPEVIEGMHSIIARVSELERLPIGSGPFDGIVGSVKAGGGTRASRRDDILTQDFLMDPSCRLTNPSEDALGLLDSLVRSAEVLSPYLTLLPMSGIANVRLQGSKEEQLSLLVGLIRSGNWTTRKDKDWKNVRNGALWLCTESRVFGELSVEQVETELLKGMLSSTQFKLVSELYVGKRKPTPLPDDVVEAAVLHSVIHEFYDNASNGNKTRGSMKNANNGLQILYPNHSSSLPLAKAARLISATHALSNYSLTLTPGVPLKPLQIRIHPDPVSLISRVLQSNAKSYTQVDTLLSIARDLRDGTSPADSPLKGSSDPQLDARVTGMCVEAALGEDDFETAYSLIMTRLIKRTARGASSSSSSSSSASEGSEKDVAWQSCLQAGRYRREAESGFLSLRQLEMRMDLLGQALLICPPVAMGEVLGLWRRCEDELNELLEQEAVEEERHANLGRVSSTSIFPSGAPSQKSRNRGEEEGPMSLFEMAAGATRVFARGSGGGSGGHRPEGEYEGDADGERIRKRDMLSGMVTSGSSKLASGLGWVLGANQQ